MSQTALADLSAADLAALLDEQRAAYEQLITQGLKLDLTRGKPSSEQLDLSNALLSLPTGVKDRAGADVRNYGGLEGLAEIREMFAELLAVEVGQIIAQGNSSLTLMKDVLVNHLLFGGVDSPRPWSAEEKVRFICPVPGYDRHFGLLESLGIEMISVDMLADGPDVDAIEALVADDASIKGMWLVPTYANPTGSVVTVEVAERLAAMKTAAPDFLIMWDNAYALHHLTEEEFVSADVIGLCAQASHPNRAVMFASTSKITFAGAGVAFLAASEATIGWFTAILGNGSIGPDKVNHLRHVEFFGDADGVRAHMARHRDILAPKFAEVDRVLTERLGGLGVATWNTPAGGYFVNLDVVEGTATRVVELAKAAGVALTPAGSSFPYKQDPADTNIRLAPSLPPVAEVTASMDAVATCVLIAAAEKLTAGA